MAYQDALAVLADPTRRAVLEALRRKPLSVGDLAERLPVSRPAVSQHLKALAAAGLVRHEAQGTRRLYEVDPAGLAALRAWLDGFWGRTLAAFADEQSKAARPRTPRARRETT